MQIANADTFTFGSKNTMFLTGQTGSGKSILQDKLIDNLVSSNTPKTLQFVLLDMTGHDFQDLRENHNEFIRKYIAFISEEGLDVIEEMVILSGQRIDSSINEPQIFICIEECDIACLDQKRFDNAVIKINQNAKKANMKLIYSTSSPRTDVISKQLMSSFDLIVAGQLMNKSDYAYLGVPIIKDTEQYSFTVVDDNHNHHPSPPPSV